MTRIDLLMSMDRAEIFVNIVGTDGPTRLLASVDTGAQISLFPRVVAERLFGDLSDFAVIEIEQARLSTHFFSGLSGVIPIQLEDGHGNMTAAMDVPCWFADTNTPLLGFAGALDRATLWIDMRRERAGWVEFND